MTHQPPGSQRNRSRGSFHALRLARRISHRTGKAPLGQRSRQANVREFRTRLLIVLTMALGFELSAAALTSPILGINRIVIHGLERLPAREAGITTRTAALQPGTNLLRAPLGQMERQMKALPWVQSARVKWASQHTLDVRFTLRQPVIIAAVAGNDYELDETGVPIRLARQGPARSLPHMTLENQSAVRFGAPIGGESVVAAIRLYRNAPQQPMVRIAKIKVDPSGNMCLNMMDGIQVQLGQPEDLAAKMKYIRRVYELDPKVGSRMVAINLSVLKQPACTLKTDLLTDSSTSTAETTKVKDHEPEGAPTQ